MPPGLAETLDALPGWRAGLDALWREVHLPPHLDEELRRHVDVDAAAMDRGVEMDPVEGGTRFVLPTDHGAGASELDLALAAHIDDLAERLSAQPGRVPF
jgi:hypothetical protein